MDMDMTDWTAAGTEDDGELLTYIVDLETVYSADELHAELREVLPLPEHYGNNLDALYDVLTEWTKPCVIRFIHTGEAEAAMPKYMRALRRLCEDVQEENPNLEMSVE